LTLFDSHFHIIDPRFPLVTNQGYLPPEFTCTDYLNRAKHLGIVGGAIVSASFQGFDQSYLIDALKQLGPSFVGVTQLPFSVKNEEILHLNEAGIRALRFNLKRGGSEGVEKLEVFAKRVYEIARWHVELYVDAVQLPELSATLLKLPAVVIDHLGLSKKGFPALLGLVEKGVKVKASGFSRVDFDVASGLKDLAAANPSGILFGTDLPSTRAPRPFSDADIQLILENFDSALARKILYSNAVEFYDVKTLF
jgi:predicted TIM-barrel fold metal-dependent hydrolase